MLNDEPEILEEIRAANQRFYDAFNELSIERMDEVWENSDRAMCVHPGWTPIVGWQHNPRELGAHIRQRQPDAVQRPLPERRRAG